MKHSETISALTEALAKAQGSFPAVQKSGENKHLGNQYSTLDDIIAAVRKPLAANGLSFVQPLTADEGTFLLETILMHQSGEWLSSEATVPNLSGNRAVNELQAFGTSLTYMRRYMLTAMLGVTAEEDMDGNGASGNGQMPKQAAMPTRQQAKPQQATNGKRPYSPEAIMARLTPIVAAGSGAPATDKQRQLIASKLNECFAADPDADKKRHTITNYLFGFESANDPAMKQGHVDAVLKWVLLDGKKDDTGDYPLHPKAPAEAAAIVREALIAEGQTEFDTATDELFDTMMEAPDAA